MVLSRLTLVVAVGLPLVSGCPGSKDARPDARITADATLPSDAATMELVDVTIHGEVLLANGYPGQIHPLFRADLGSGSALARVKLYARFCADAACAIPLAVVAAEVAGTDADGAYVLASASTSGTGFAKAFTIPRAPRGASYLQLVGDTDLSRQRGLGTCTGVTDCPGDLDVVASATFMVGQNVDGSVVQPAAAAVPVTVERAATITLPSTIYLGHLIAERGVLATPAPADPGTLMAAVSNAADTHRNAVAMIALADASAHPGQVTPASYTLMKGSTAFAGDLCGFVAGSTTTMYAIAIDDDGANVFPLSATTGAQLSTTPVVVIPPSDPLDANTYPYPCRGVFGSVAGTEHLYLITYKGAGALATSYPAPLYDVNLTAGTVTTPITNTNLALRGIALDATAGLFAVDMSWSQDAATTATPFDRVLGLGRDASGTITGIAATTLTDLTSNDQCGSTAHWPSGMAMINLGGSPRLVLGHDGGVAVYDPSTITKVSDLSLAGFGRLFTQLVPGPTGDRLYAVPECKAVNTATTFQLPYGAGTEAADTNLVAILDTSGATLKVAATTIDIDHDGTLDQGIDLDYYHLKSFIRAHGSTLPIPPVVFTGVTVAVGRSMLFARGSGLQGNGSTAISTSGLGQVQDLGFFDLASGRGIVFGDYVPWFEGLSATAETGTGIWGYDLDATRATSVGAVYYLP